MQHNAAFHLGLHCFRSTCLGVSLIQMVKGKNMLPREATLIGEYAPPSRVAPVRIENEMKGCCFKIPPILNTP